MSGTNAKWIQAAAFTGVVIVVAAVSVGLLGIYGVPVTVGMAILMLFGLGRIHATRRKRGQPRSG